GDEILDADVGGVVDDLCAPLIDVLFADFAQLGDDDLLDLAFVAEDLLVTRDALQHVGVLFEDLVALHVGQALQAHVENRLGLELAEAELAHQTGAGGCRIGRGADQRDHRIEVLDGDLEAFQDMQAFLRLAQVVDRASRHHILAVADEDLQRILEIEQLRTPADDRQHIDAERVLQLAELEELVLHDLRDGVALELDDHAHAVAIGFVAQVGDALDALLVHHLRDALDEARLVHLIGQLAHDDLRLAAIAAVLDLGAGAHLQHAAPGVVRLADRGAAMQEPGGGKVGAGNVAHELVNRHARRLDQRDQRIDDLAEIVRRDVG